MITADIRSERDRIRSLFKAVIAEQNKVSMTLLPVFSSYMAVKASGFVEISVKEILSEYGRRNSNNEIRTFIVSNVHYENSLNCEKIQKLLDRFDKTWWVSIVSKIDQSTRDAINSLKTIRDQVAHGKNNGTGIIVINQYFESSVKFIKTIASEIIP